MIHDGLIDGDGWDKKAVKLTIGTYLYLFMGSSTSNNLTNLFLAFPLTFSYATPLLLSKTPKFQYYFFPTNPQKRILSEKREVRT
jgi:hypothetical protein